MSEERSRSDVQPPERSVEMRQRSPIPSTEPEPLQRVTRLAVTVLGGEVAPKISHTMEQLEGGRGYRVELIAEGAVSEEQPRIPAVHLG